MTSTNSLRHRDNQKSVRHALVNPDSFVTVLLLIVIDEYGTEAFSWSPLTLVSELESDLNVEIPRVNVDKMMTGINHITSDDFWQSLPDFISMCNAFSGEPVSAELWDPADIMEIAWGVAEAYLLDPPEDEAENPFNPEIVAYMAEVMKDSGLVAPPEILHSIVPISELRTNGEFSDDPIMYGAIYQSGEGKSDDVDQMVGRNIQKLMDQLVKLKLQHGDPAASVKKMLAKG